MKKENFEKILKECDAHVSRLESAVKKMSAFMPVTENKYMHLTEEEIAYTDQFLFRFVKLQDSMGQKLFPKTLSFLEEDVRGVPFIDILHRLEKLGLLNSMQWQELREIRNELAHNYEDDVTEILLALNTIYAKKENMINIYKTIKNFVQSRL